MQKVQTETGKTVKTGFWRDAWHRLCKNKGAMLGLFLLLALILCALFAGVLAPYPYDLQDYSHIFEGPSALHLLGTDNFGRDILSRIIYGARISLLVGFSSIITAIIVGGLLGAVAGFYGGRVDNSLMRAMDILMSIPGMLMAISRRLWGRAWPIW